MWIIAGLGNPDQSYAGTRHNAGRDFLMAIAREEGVGEFSYDKKLRAQVAKGELFDAKATLVCPDTMMNSSGAALKPLIKSIKQAEQLIVLHDDLDLPLGSIKLSFGSGAGGHHGVESVQKVLRTRNFARIRIGISPRTPKGKARKPDRDEVIDFVLGSFRPREREYLTDAQKTTAEALKLILTEGLPHAMTAVNAA